MKHAKPFNITIQCDFNRFFKPELGITNLGITKLWLKKPVAIQTAESEDVLFLGIFFGHYKSSL